MPETTSNSRLHTPISSVNYAIVKGPELQYERHGTLSATVDYRVAASDVLAFAEELMPTPQQDGDAVILQKPTFLRGASQLLAATRIVVRSFNDSKPWNAFTGDANPPVKTYENDVLVSVTYGTVIECLFNGPRTNKKPETILEEKFSATVEMLAIHSNKNLLMQQADLSYKPVADVSSPIVKIIPIVERSFRWSWAINPDFAMIWSRMGLVNSGENGGNGSPGEEFLGGAAAETVLFLGVQGEVQYRPSGLTCRKVWVLDYKFAQRQITESGNTYGWNHAYDAKNAKFARVRRQVDGQSATNLYSTINFGSLFAATA